jgi:hypothetical protein
MLRRRIDHIHLRKLQGHDNSGWRARETLCDGYTIWGNSGLTARERQHAERLGVGRLWDLRRLDQVAWPTRGRRVAGRVAVAWKPS